MKQRVDVKIEAGIASIELDDGKVNALSTDVLVELARALDVAREARAVTVLRGRRGIFSAGFDLRTFDRGPEASVDMVRTGAELVLRVLSHPLPVLAVCTGHAYPMGAFLMLAADVRLALAGDWRIGLNEVAIGMTVPRFAVELARHRLTPPGFARIATGALFGPEEARHLGYVDRVVGPEQLEAAVREESERLRNVDFASHAATKQRINQAVSEAVRAAIDSELLERGAA